MTIEYVSLPGESRPPIPAGPDLCSGDEMRILHNAFLWGYEQAPGLVRSTPAGDTARSAYVGQWLANLDATLHTHHDGEDRFLWDKLEKRAPACALHVGQMRAQHAQVAALLDEASPLLTDWTASADPAVGEQLAAEYERLLAVLTVHLRREVVELMPVTEKVVTQKEWDAIGEYSMKEIPLSRLFPQLGLLLANASPADKVEFWKQIPGPAKVLWRLAGKRQYTKQFRTLFPNRAVPPTM